jgi:excisionase family DNA binding protein
MPIAEQPEKLTGTISEAAEVLGIGRNQGYDAARRGEIPVMTIGKRKIVLWQPFMRKLHGQAA